MRLPYWTSGRFLFAMLALVACVLFAAFIGEPLYTVIGFSMGIFVACLYIVTECIVEKAYLRYATDERRNIFKSAG